MDKSLLIIGASLFALTPAVALAQASSSEVVGLEEVIVTAQKRSENLQNAALAVSAVTGSAISEAGVTNPIELSKLVPSVQIGSSAGAVTSYFIRGVGKVSFNSLVDSAVLVNIDGVSLGRSSTSGGFFFDLERVEVLKGPQGTLYGRNATGGAINIITRKASFDAVGGFLEAEVGNYDAYRVSGAVNVPVNDRLAVRAAAQLVQREGYLTDGTSDEKSEAVRLNATVKLTESATLQLSADYAHFGGKGAGNVVVPFIDGDDRQIGLLDPRARSRQTSVLVPFAGNFLPAPPTDPFLDADNWGLSAQLDLETGLGTLTVLPAYRETNPNNRFVPVQVINSDETAKQKSLEVRLTSGDDQALKYVLGAYYFDEDVHYEAYNNQLFNLAARDVTLPTTSQAVFARLNYSITDRFRIDGGVRYTQDEKSIVNSCYNVRVVCPAGPTGCIGGPALPFTAAVPAFIFDANGRVIPVQPYGMRGNLVTAIPIGGADSEDYTSTTYHLGLEYDLAERSLLYFNYDTGYKAGGFFSTIPQDPASFGPEKMEAYTIGSKNRFLDNRLQLNLEVFHWKYKDQQVSHFSLDTLGGTTFRTSNIGQSTIKGVEVEAQWAATDNTLLTANVQYLDAKNDQFIYRTVNLGGPPNTGCSFRLDGRFYVVNCSGTRPTMVSEWTMNFSGQQTFPLANGAELVANLSTRYQSDYNAGFDLLPLMYQKSYWTTDASLTYNAPEDRYFVTAFVRNIEDYTPMAASIAPPQTAAYVIATLRPPRTYGVRMGVKF
jgi:iron complex outermembrane recepter protein